MKVLFQSRKTLFTGPGGDTIQILKTKEYLEHLGVDIDISTELEPEVSNYDLVHIFNLMRPQETHLQVKNAKKSNRKIVLSTIYGLYTEYERKARGGVMQKLSGIMSPFQIEYSKILARGIIGNEIHKGTTGLLLKGYHKTLQEILDSVDILLPNSQQEMNRINNDFELNGTAYQIIPNAVDKVLFNYDAVKVDDNVKKYAGCILCVSRTEGRKCQLNIVKALKSLPFKLIFIGKPAPNHVEYYERLKKEAGLNTVLLDHVSHSELPQYYKIAKVHTLVSWMETPGLSSLEAAAMKCNIVVTHKGDTDEYFGNYAYYCEPDNIDSIRGAIVDAYNAPFNENFRKHILSNYTWEIAARKTLAAYEQILNKK